MQAKRLLDSRVARLGVPGSGNRGNVGATEEATMYIGIGSVLGIILLILVLMWIF
jgi:hypothetical protein